MAMPIQKKREGRVGLFGGTFNPIHNGHLAAADEVAELFQLDRVIFIPNGRPPHKIARGLFDARHRYQMVLISTNSNPRFQVSRVELDRKGVSYSIDTVEQIRKEHGSNLFFMTGFGAFKDIGTWKSVSRLFTMCNFIVTIGPGQKPELLMDVLEKTVTRRYKTLRFQWEATRKRGPYRKIRIVGSKYGVYPVRINWLDISSTLIRTKLKKGKSVRYLVDPGVENYLEKEQLFKRSK